MQKTIRFTALLLVVGALMLTIDPSFAQAQTVKGSIRLVNVSPDAPPLDFYFNQKKTNSALKFKDITNYTDIDVGTYNIKAFAAPSDGTGTPLFEVPGFNVSDGSVSTVVTVGMVKNKSLTLLPLSDNNQIAVADSTKAKVRFIHGSPDAPAVNVQVAGVGDIFNNISFKSIGNYVTAPAGALTLTVKAASNPSTVILSTTLDLKASSVYTVFVVGEATTNGLATVVTVDKAIMSMPNTGQGNSPGENTAGSGWLLISLFGLMAVSGFGFLKQRSSVKR